MGTIASSETPDGNRANLAPMSEDKGQSAKEAARKAREERLAAALRANLRRRKAGARQAAESPKSAMSGPTASPDDQRK
jgi:hypothetical protein